MNKILTEWRKFIEQKEIVVDLEDDEEEEVELKAGDDVSIEKLDDEDEELDEYDTSTREKKRGKYNVRKRGDPPSVRKRKLPWETFAGYDDRNGGLKQLANGIVEGCLGSPHHDELGRWTSPDKAKVFSTGYKGDNTSKDCDHGKWKSSGGSRGAASDKPCGRKPSGEKYNIRCKDNKKLWQEYFDEETQLVSISVDDLEKVMYGVLNNLMADKAIIEGVDLSRDKALKLCNRYGYMSFQQFLVKQNALVASAKGDYGKD
jgi:hypothetical protein